MDIGYYRYILGFVKDVLKVDIACVILPCLPLPEAKQLPAPSGQLSAKRKWVCFVKNFGVRSRGA